MGRTYKPGTQVGLAARAHRVHEPRPLHYSDKDAREWRKEQAAERTRKGEKRGTH